LERQIKLASVNGSSTNGMRLVFNKVIEAPPEAVVPYQHISAERRLKIRYPLSLDVRFRSFSGPSLGFGSGRAVDLSSGGVYVISEHALFQHEVSVGARVEMGIAWPFLLDETIPIQLFAVGRVLRRGACDFAATFEKHEFRTRSATGMWASSDVIELSSSDRAVLR
jgi:hypothetical protein